MYPSCSYQQNVLCVMPQSLFLGPRLFSIYINDLPKASTFQTRLIAGNAALLISS